MKIKWRSIISALAIIACVGACASACSAPWSGKTQAGKASTSGEPSASQSNADTDFGEDSGHLASSLQALAKRMLNDDNTLKKEKKDSDDVMSTQQRDIIVRATKNNGNIAFGLRAVLDELSFLHRESWLDRSETPFIWWVLFHARYELCWLDRFAKQET